MSRSTVDSLVCSSLSPLGTCESNQASSSTRQKLTVFRETTVTIGTRVNENTSVLDEIKNKVHELNSRSTDVDVDVNVHGSTIFGARQTRTSPATNRVELEVRLEPATVRDNLRSELMLLMTGQGPYANASNTILPISSRLSHEDRARIASMLISQLQHPDVPPCAGNFAVAK